MAIIAMRNPAFGRAFGSIAAVIRAPGEAVRDSVAEACSAVGKPLSAAMRIHLATHNSPKETTS